MALSVNTNIGALNALAASSAATKSLETAMARLSSGKRINSAGDDAAGVAIASRLSSEVRGTNMAIRNASDAQSLINTAEGASVEITNILQRMREVAVQAANDTNSTADRVNLAAELTALTAEIDRIANVTTWAGENLLDGATPNATTTDADDASFVFQIGSGTSAADTLTVAIGSMGSTALGIAGTGLAATSFVEITDADSLGAIVGQVLTLALPVDTKSYTFNINGTEFTSTFSATGEYATSAIGFAAQIEDEINAANLSGITVTNDGAAGLTISQGTALVISSAATALTAIGTIDTAIAQVSTQRAGLGSVSNRLDHTIANLTNVSANLQAGLGRVEDADFAAESTNMAKANILAQASTAMLAQANASKQGVLQLLQR